VSKSEHKDAIAPDPTEIGESNDGDRADVAGSREGARHRGREVALQVLYAIDLASDEGVTPRALQDQIFTRIVENFDVPPAVENFAKELAVGVVERIDGLDEILGVHARNWRVSRMAAVDRNVLRLGVFELRDTDLPVAVVIDEAVDLARRFGSDSSPAFVNGVLDAVAREVRAA
jgi:N utilization substance protein B